MGGGERGMGCADQSKACVTLFPWDFVFCCGLYDGTLFLYVDLLCRAHRTISNGRDCSIRPWAHSRPQGPATWRGLVEVGSGQVEVALGRVEVGPVQVEVVSGLLEEAEDGLLDLGLGRVLALLARLVRLALLRLRDQISNIRNKQPGMRQAHAG